MHRSFSRSSKHTGIGKRQSSKRIASFLKSATDNKGILIMGFCCSASQNVRRLHNQSSRVWWLESAEHRALPCTVVLNCCVQTVLFMLSSRSKVSWGPQRLSGQDAAEAVCASHATTMHSMSSSNLTLCLPCPLEQADPVGRPAGGLEPSVPLATLQDVCYGLLTGAWCAFSPGALTA